MSRLAPAAVLVALVVGGGLLGPAPAPAEARPAPPGLTLRATLDRLPERPTKPKVPGYDREDDYGSGWRDPRGPACDMRQQVLARDLTGERTAPGKPCKIVSGTLVDPFTGRTVAFRPGNTVQVDHVVSLEDHYQSGGHLMTEAQRRAYANDLRVLVALEGKTNGSKGGRNASAWRPRARFQCEFARRIITIKDAQRTPITPFGLSVTPPERAALRDMLSRC